MEGKTGELEGGVTSETSGVTGFWRIVSSVPDSAVNIVVIWLGTYIEETCWPLVSNCGRTVI